MNLAGRIACERTKAAIAMRLALSCAVLSALSACGASSSGQTTDTTPPAGTAKPQVSLVSTPNTVAKGQSATLKWNAANAQSCMASGGWSGAQAVSGEISTNPLMSNTSFTLTCTGAGGTDSQSADVIVDDAPTVKLAAAPTTVASGGSSELTWSSTGATACTASGAWSGPLATSGTWSTGALTNTSDYGLTCTGAGGPATQSATVTVAGSPATVTLSVSPSTVNSGGASTLTWSSRNAATCSASGAWSGAKALSGSQTTGALTVNATYGLTCAGSGGSATQSATVSVISPSPVITLKAAPSTIASGTSSTLSWSAAN